MEKTPKTTILAPEKISIFRLKEYIRRAFKIDFTKSTLESPQKIIFDSKFDEEIIDFKEISIKELKISSIPEATLNQDSNQPRKIIEKLLNLLDNEENQFKCIVLFS